MAQITLSDREISTILAGLRSYQRDMEYGYVVRAVEVIANDDGFIDPMDTTEIDELCIKLNCS